MEPKFSSPELNTPNPDKKSESLPVVPSIESSPEVPFSSPEVESANPERAAEYAAQAQAGVAAQPIPITLPTPVAIPSAGTASALPVDDLPATAADEDLIEKEWVDKAKQIISQTRDDPARREREVGRLQVDYLKKRYGKELGTAPE